MSPSDCNNDWQLEMAMWLPKSDILISLELRQIGWQFQRQIWGFWTHPAGRNWPRAIATTTRNDNIAVLLYCYSKLAISSSRSITVAIIWLILYRALHHRKSWIWHWNFDAICHSSSDVIRLHHIPMVKTIVFANIIILSLFLPKRSLADKHETYTGMDPKLT